MWESSSPKSSGEGKGLAGGGQWDVLVEGTGVRKEGSWPGNRGAVMGVAGGKVDKAAGVNWGLAAGSGLCEGVLVTGVPLWCGTGDEEGVTGEAVGVLPYRIVDGVEGVGPEGLNKGL